MYKYIIDVSGVYEKQMANFEKMSGRIVIEKQLIFCRSDEGDKELEKERERITPFITFQQVTTTSTNASSSGMLPSTQQTEAVTKIVSTLTSSTGSRRETLQLTSTKQEPLSSILPCSSLLEIAKIASATTTADESSNTMSLLTTPDVLATTNGEALLGSHDLTMPEHVPSISSPQVSTISMIQEVMGPVSLEQVVHNSITTTMTNPSATGLQLQLPPRKENVPSRLKRPYVEVDDVVVTPSAKRSIVPTAYIASYTPIHHSPQLSSKQLWGAETGTMIIDQHNNNG